MEKIIAYLQSLPSEDFIKSICILIFTSCSGLIPNNNDISLAAAGLIANLKNLSPFYVAMAATFSWIAGETTVFLFGRILGKKVFDFKFVRKKMSEERQHKISSMLNENPVRFFMIIRLTPVLRACSILTMGGLGLAPVHFFTKHIPLLFSYAVFIFFFFYWGGTWIKSVFAENSMIVMSTIVTLWFMMMVLVGRNFIKKLK